MSSHSKEAQHEILSGLKGLASSLGRVPSRTEFLNAIQISRHALEKMYGSYTTLLHAAGLKESPKEAKARRKEALKQLFHSPIPESPNESSKTQHNPSSCLSEHRIAVLGDTHFPWVSTSTLSYFYAFIEEMKPTHIVQIGDLYDMFAHSKFPKSVNTYNPAEEISKGFTAALNMWATIKKICPNAKLHGILGNHDIRPLKRILESYPEGEIFFSIDKYFQFEGVEYQMNIREPLEIAGIVFHHGHTGTGKHFEHNMMNTVVGHTHRGDTTFRRYKDKILWELNAGLAGDAEAKCMSYTPVKITKMTEGFGYIDKWGPRFVPAY